MRSIEMISPFQALRGNLSGSQKLKYAKHDNPAFDAPVGRQYAKNYQTRYIGARRASDGRCYFAVKTKSATRITAESKVKMAVLGGAGAIFADIQRHASTANSIYTRCYQAYKNSGNVSTMSFRQHIMTYVMNMLQSKLFSVSVGRDNNSDLVYIHNPWFQRTRPETAYIPEVGNEVLVKFWIQLAKKDNSAALPIIFTIDTTKGVAFVGDAWEDYISTTYNNLHLTIDVGTQAGDVLKYGDDIVADPANPTQSVAISAEISATTKYITIAAE